MPNQHDTKGANQKINQDTNQQAENLKTVVKGAGLFLLGYIISYVISFVYRVVIARSFGPANYGLLTIAITVVGVCRTLSLAGLDRGVIRYVGFYNGKNQEHKSKATINTAFILVTMFSIAVSAVIFLLSETIAVQFFHNKELIAILKIFAAVIILNSLVEIFKAIFIAFKKAEYSVFTETFGEKFVCLVFTAIAIFAGASLIGASYAYLIAYIATLVMAYAIYKLKIISLMKCKIAKTYNFKELMGFSFPLLISGLLGLSLGWSDVLLIGFFKNETEVGIYNVGYSFAYSLLMFSRSFSYLYYPISAELYSQRKIKQIKADFETVSRWTFMSTFPAFLLLIFFGQYIINLFFGPQFIAAWTPLIITATGILIYCSLGPFAIILETCKRVKYIFKTILVITIINIILNIALIPPLGIIGAAISSALAFAVIGLCQFLKVRQLFKIRLKLKYYAKYILSGLISLTAIYLLTKIVTVNVVMIFCLVVLYAGLYLLLLLLFKSFSKNDKMMFFEIKKNFA